MAIRQFIAGQLAVAAKAVANDRSKEKTAVVINQGRRKLAEWIKPKEDVQPVQIRINTMISSLVTR